MPRCCGHSSVNFPRGQRDCGFSEAQGGSQERLGTFGLSFQAGLPKVWKLQHRYFILPNLSSSSPAKPGPGTQKEVSLETLGISFTISTLLFLPFPRPTPPSPGTLSLLFHLWVGFVIWQGRGWQQTLSHQLAQLHTSVIPWPQCPGIPLSHTYPK